MQSLRRRVWATRFFENSVPDAFDAHFFNGLLELAQANPDGITNSDTAKTLGLQSNYLGGSKDYLSWSLLGLLMQEGKMVRGDHKKHKATVK